ncbi:hypothetical protein [Microlunatus sp. Y2014]|uniref:hypothetical protein n=1 Tax=Microlunatus sp. Y2014 TaxID=3418488 RepID=UPI003DA75ABA
MKLSRREFTATTGLAGLGLFGAGALGTGAFGLTAAPAVAADPTDPEVVRFTSQDPAIRYLGQPVNSQIGARSPRVGQEDGRWVEYQVFKGSANTDLPGTFAVTDIETGELVRSIKLPTAEACFDLTVATDGKVYLPSYFDYHLWRYDPATKAIDDLGPINDDAVRDYAFGAGYGPNGIAFLGTYSESRLHRVDPSGVITNLGTVDPDEDYIHFVCWDPESDAVFCATGGKQARVWRVADLGAGERTMIIDGSVVPQLQGTQFLGMLDCVEGRLVMRSDGRLIVTDLDGNIEYYDETEKVLTGYHVVPTRDRSGFIFSRSGGALGKYDFATASHIQVAGTVRGYVCHAVETAENLIMGSDSGGPFTVNYVTGERTERSVAFRQPTLIQKIFPGPGATMYASGYMSGFAKINTDGGEPNHTVNMGQFESWMVRDGLMYLAGYGHSKFYSYDPNQPEVKPRQLYTSADHEFDRPFAMAYNPDRDEVYVGSVPGYGRYQGGISVYDFATGEVEFFGAEIAQDQGVISAAYNPHDELVYFGTTIDGGMGNDPTSITTEGQVVVFDPATRQVVRRFVPVAGRQGVTGLLVDPDGSVWGVAEELLIRIDPQGEVHVYGAVSRRYPAPPEFIWAWAYLNWSSRDGMIYGSARGTMFRIDPATKEVTNIATDGASWSSVDAAGDVYFAYRTHCFRYLVPYAPSGEPTDASKCAAIRAFNEGRSLRFPADYPQRWRRVYEVLQERVAAGQGDRLEQALCAVDG